MKKAKDKEYIATTGINATCSEDNPEGTRYEPGDPVPAAVVEKSPWLLEQGAVVVKGDDE